MNILLILEGETREIICLWVPSPQSNRIVSPLYWRAVLGKLRFLVGLPAAVPRKMSFMTKTLEEKLKRLLLGWWRGWFVGSEISSQCLNCFFILSVPRYYCSIICPDWGFELQCKSNKGESFWSNFLHIIVCSFHLISIKFHFLCR